MEISDAIFEAATQRGEAIKASFPLVVSARYDKRISRVVISLAHPADVSDAQISASGLGVHFPKIDADIYIPALLEGFLGSKRWMAAQMGKIGGKASTAAKASAARENGKRGGRPRKAGKLVAAAT